jgi:hypothetical protein
MRDSEVGIDPKCLLVGLGGLIKLPGCVASQAEVIPCLGIVGQQFNRSSQPPDGLRRAIGAKQAFALEQRARPSRRAPAQHGRRHGADDRGPCEMRPAGNAV